MTVDTDGWARRPPAPKRRRRWCRGRTGVEHTPDSRRRVFGRDMPGSCADLPWNNPDFRARLPRVWRRREFYWECRHERYCTTCGRILDRTLGMDCPDRPTDRRPT